MVKKIKFTIDSNGEVAMNVEGVQGSSCKTLTEPFESLLGDVSKRTLKDVYYADETIETTNEQETKN